MTKPTTDLIGDLVSALARDQVDLQTVRGLCDELIDAGVTHLNLRDFLNTELASSWVQLVEHFLDLSSKVHEYTDDMALVINHFDDLNRALLLLGLNNRDQNQVAEESSG